MRNLFLQTPSPGKSKFPSNKAPTTTDEIAFKATFGETTAAAAANPNAKTKMQLTRLATVAGFLNELSDELTKQVSEIEATLNALNLGVRAEGVPVTLELDEDTRYHHWLRLAYGKKASKWGFIVEELETYPSERDDTYTSWLFKDAPREFRLKVVDSIPVLMDALAKESDHTAKEIAQKVEFVKDLSFKVPNISQKGPTK